MSALHDAPMFPRLTGTGVFRMLHGWQQMAPLPDLFQAASRRSPHS